MKSAQILSLLLFYSISMIEAFTVSSSRVKITTSRTTLKTLLKMSETEETVTEPDASKDGTFYDDEVRI